MGLGLVASRAAARFEKASNTIESVVSSLTRLLLRRRVKLLFLSVYLNAVDVLSGSQTSHRISGYRY